MPSRYSLRRITAIKTRLVADLRILYRQPYSEEALEAALPLLELGLPSPYHDALRLPLVRVQVQMAWQALEWSLPDRVDRLNARQRHEWAQRIESEAEQTAQWICGQHLPAEQDRVFDLAVLLWRRIKALVEPSADPCSPRPLEGQHGEESSSAERDPIGSLLRMSPIRERIIAERERRIAEKRKGLRNSWDAYRDQMRLHKILRSALVLYAQPLLGGSIAHRIQFTEISEAEEGAERILRDAAKLLKCSWLPVVRSGHGQCEIIAAAFLQSVYDRAKSQKHWPVYCEVLGSTHAARLAKDCSAILLFLGDAHRRYLDCEGPEFVSLNDIVRAVKDATGGKHYKRIKRLTDALVALGLVVRVGPGGKAGWRFLLALQIADRRMWQAVYAGRSSFREKVK